MQANRYHPFGMGMPGRQFAVANGYRYGFNGKENDNEVKGEGSQQDYGMRIYDARLGRFLSEDPIASNFPWNSPYSYAEGDPINYIDLDGLEKPEKRAVATPSSTRPKVDIKVDKDLLDGKSGGKSTKLPRSYKSPNFRPISNSTVLLFILETFTSTNDSHSDKVLYQGAKSKDFKDISLNEKWAEEHHRMGYPDDVVNSDKEQDVVYRGGPFTTTNFTPRPGTDDGEGPKSGLSTNRSPQEATRGQGGKAQAIDLNILRNFGFHITETPDGHVGIRPPSRKELKDWAKTRGEKIHYRTVMTMSARIGEVRLPKKK